MKQLFSVHNQNHVEKNDGHNSEFMLKSDSYLPKKIVLFA